MSNVFEIKPGIFYTGVVDKDLEIFDIIMETKYGTTYNSYLIKDEKVVYVSGTELIESKFLADDDKYKALKIKLYYRKFYRWSIDRSFK